MSTNRTVVDLVAAESVDRAELRDLPLHPPLLLFKPPLLALEAGKRREVPRDECADRGAVLRCPDARSAIDVVRDRDRDIFHSFTVSHFHN